MNNLKTYESKGYICVKKYNLIYYVCKLTYILNEDDTFKYIFEPNYSVIDLLDTITFQGIPGLNLDLRKKEYIRDDRIPTFISERVPSEKREDYQELLAEVGMDYMDPIIYLTNTKKKYSGDNLFVLPYKEKELFILEKSGEKTDNNNTRIKRILENICIGNDIQINNQIINDTNRKMMYDMLIEGYVKTYELNKKLQRDGIDKAKALGKYKGRKPIYVDKLMFLELLGKVENKKISPVEAAKILGISIDKYYRYKKKLQN